MTVPRIGRANRAKSARGHDDGNVKPGPVRRTAVAGDEIELVVLALASGELIGIDTVSGSFVRAADPGGPPLATFDVVRAELRAAEAFLSPHAPEAVELAPSPIEAVAQLPARRAERYLRPLVDPPGEQLLGFAGSATPFWALKGERPSLALVRPTEGPAIRAADGMWRCRFGWRGRDHDLPLFDSRLLAILAAEPERGAGPDGLTRSLGFAPELVVVALSAPFEGRCYKVAAGFLPRP